ncbi:hypothetical protein ASD04_14775 [Devosia sp. Root436]|uniref:hypothetical protein n=1 Tax=Devosia sp. Root436 TaxID=1736537 RepID=UPI0006FB6B54|nr:hypothetical protein [Devosia sp. Root436]KQX35303.1 hypothetical protein ASD04_14775 [Devosia sp. Root436]
MTGGRFSELVLAALFGACSALILAWLKSSRDDHWETFKHFIEQVMAVAEDGTDYWLLDANDDNRLRLEAKILGGQTYLQHHSLLVFGRLRVHEMMPLVQSLALFLDSLSGGDFRSPTRTADFQRASDCQVRAAELAVLARQTFSKSVTLMAMFKRFTRYPFAG